jgi:hypothetical protein
MDKPSKVIPESVVTPLVGMHVAEVLEKRNNKRLLRIGTVLEIIHFQRGGALSHQIRYSNYDGRRKGDLVHEGNT